MNKKTSFISDFKAIVFAALLIFVLIFPGQSVFARTPAEIRNQEELNISQDMSSQDLSGNDFVKLDLKGINFSESNLTGAEFNNSKLNGFFPPSRSSTSKHYNNIISKPSCWLIKLKINESTKHSSN